MMKKMRLELALFTLGILLSAVIAYYSFGAGNPASDIRVWYADALSSAPASLTWALLLGLIIGVMICPTCGFPLGFYISGAEGTASRGIKAALLFNAGRLITTLILGFAVTIAGASLVSQSNRTIGFGFAGVLMLVFSAELLGISNLGHRIAEKIRPKISYGIMQRLLNIGVNRPVEYLTWGLLLGVVCSAEFIVPLLAVWGLSIVLSGITFSLLAVLLFGVGTTIPITILAVTGGGSVEVLQKYTVSNVRKYAGYTGATFMSLLGTQYVVAALVTANAVIGYPTMLLILSAILAPLSILRVYRAVPRLSQR